MKAGLVALPPHATRPSAVNKQARRYKQAMSFRVGATTASRRVARSQTAQTKRYLNTIATTTHATFAKARRSAHALRYFGSSTTSAHQPLPPPVSIDETEIDPLSPDAQTHIAQALSPHYKSQTPVVLRSMLSKSDAYYCWKSLDYLHAAVGGDTPVYVEIGSYADANVQKPEITFGEYVEFMRHFENKYGDGAEKEGLREEEEQPPPHEIVYLAQNDLPPALYGDFDMPKLCDDASFARKYGVGEGNLYSCMIWMGPRGTLSPLHFDPLDNLLFQVVGTKRVLLYPRTVGLIDENGDVSAAEGAAWTYAGSDGMQYNTSPVDVENPDLQIHPLFAQSPPPIECILRPGDCLYIPAKWWHHVRSLSRSVSVNVWWR